MEQYFALCDGTPEERGRALDLAACLVDPSPERGYMDYVWGLARDWRRAAHNRYDVGDLVASTAEEILLALPRPSSRQAVSKGWFWFCRECFKRAREQAGLNGDDGYKAISARAVGDAQRQIARLDSSAEAEPDPDNPEPDVFIDDVVVQDDLVVGDDDEEPVEADVDEAEVSMSESGTVLEKDGHDRHTVATGMAYALRELSPNADDSTHRWLLAFVEDYLETYVAAITDPARRAVSEAVLTDVPTTRDAKADCTPLLEALSLTRDQINVLKKEERLRFKASLVREAKLSGVVHDDFVRSVLERSRTGSAPWKTPELPAEDAAPRRAARPSNPTDR
ncbi:MAG: hypothetical protein AAFQ43_00615 [Bacteroidota bacterium]